MKGIAKALGEGIVIIASNGSMKEQKTPMLFVLVMTWR